MSDYSRQHDFSTKTGTTIFGSEVDEEFDALVVSNNSKVDESREGSANGIATLGAGALIPAGISSTPASGGGQLPEASLTALGAVELATAAEAQALTDALRAITPDTLDDVLTDNAGIVKQVQAMTDPGADAIIFWDDSDSAAEFLTIGDGIEIDTNTLQLTSTLAGDGLNIASGVLSVDAGDGLVIDGTALAVVGGNGITANANDIELTDAAASTTNAVDIASGAVSLDLTALTEIAGSALAAGDVFLVDDGGVQKGIKVEEMGMRVQTAQTGQTLAAADMNTIMEFTVTSTLTLPATGMPVGVPVVLNMRHATQELTVTAAASTDLVSVNHPAGTTAGSDTVEAGGTAIVYQTVEGTWCISGNIAV